MRKATIGAGDVCRCSRGKLGMVTMDGRQPVSYPDGNTGEAYVGICLTDGKPWSSRNPERVCSIHDLVAYVAEARAEQYIADMPFGPEADPVEAARYAFRFASQL